MRDRLTAYALFTDPPLGRAGMTDTEIKRSGRKAMIGMRPMTRVGRAVEKGETLGFMKIASTRHRSAFSAARSSARAATRRSIRSSTSWRRTSPYTTLQHTVHIHPTVAELIPTLLGELKPLE